MKWWIGGTVAGVLVVLVASNWIRHDLQARQADAEFQKQVRDAEKIWSGQCGACHAPYDPRVYVLEEWTPILERSGCPVVRVDLADDARRSLLTYLRAMAAPTAKEADLTRKRERARVASEQSRRGRELFAQKCGQCHEHPYYAKTHTAREWAEALSDLGGLHRSVKEPVRLEPKEAAELLEHLGAAAAGTPSDAAAIRALVAGGAGSKQVQPPLPADEEIPWVRDLAAGLKEAKEKALPLVVDFTDLSGG
jgi:mono/diheme cytochrome c family protein